jgi:hypothetical protein
MKDIAARIQPARTPRNPLINILSGEMPTLKGWKSPSKKAEFARNESGAERLAGFSN